MRRHRASDPFHNRYDEFPKPGLNHHKTPVPQPEPARSGDGGGNDFEAAGVSAPVSGIETRSARTPRTSAAAIPIAGDIRGIAETDIPRHDVLLAGIPCQPFSEVSLPPG